MYFVLLLVSIAVVPFPLSWTTAPFPSLICDLKNESIFVKIRLHLPYDLHFECVDDKKLMTDFLDDHLLWTPDLGYITGYPNYGDQRILVPEQILYIHPSELNRYGNGKMITFSKSVVHIWFESTLKETCKFSWKEGDSTELGWNLLSFLGSYFHHGWIVIPN